MTLKRGHDPRLLPKAANPVANSNPDCDPGSPCSSNPFVATSSRLNQVATSKRSRDLGPKNQVACSTPMSWAHAGALLVTTPNLGRDPALEIGNSYSSFCLTHFLSLPLCSTCCETSENFFSLVQRVLKSQENI